MSGRRLEHDWFPEPLPDNVQLGPRSWLYSTFALRHFQSRRRCGLRVGHDTGMYNGTFFNLGPEGEVEIGSFCTLVGAIIHTNRRVVIEDFVFIAHEVVLADEPSAAPRISQPAEMDIEQAGPSEAIYIGENAWIGARAVLLSGARIGAGAIVGAAAVVDFEVPPYSIVAGNPARVVRQLGSSTGSRSRG